jgi:hypothetical protein
LDEHDFGEFDDVREISEIRFSLLMNGYLNLRETGNLVNPVNPVNNAFRPCALCLSDHSADLPASGGSDPYSDVVKFTCLESAEPAT